jgi:hydroxyacid-oxoacid transhydrogenase
VPLASAGDVLAERVLHFMRLTDQPAGISAFGYTGQDIPRLVEGTLVQARLLKLSPVAPTADLLAQLFRESLGEGS